MKLTIAEKINKTLEYCEYTKQLATNAGQWMEYLVEIENTGGLIETEQQCVDNITLHSAICQAAQEAQEYSQYFDCVSSVKVYIKTYNSECELIDEDPIDEYEINFVNGIEVQ